MMHAGAPPTKPTAPGPPISDVQPTPGIGSAVTGIGVSPALAAMLRALAYVVIVAVIDGAILKFTDSPPAALAVYSAIIIGALRQIEGILDQALKPNSNMVTK
jgi:hypothetical protein